MPPPSRARRVVSAVPWLLLLFLLGVFLGTVTAPVPPGERLRDTVGQWWARAWNELKAEGARVLPAVRTRLREDAEWPRYLLGQGLSGLPSEPDPKDSWRPWTGEVRSLVSLITDVDLDDPRALLAQYLPAEPPASPELPPSAAEDGLPLPRSPFLEPEASPRSSAPTHQPATRGPAIQDEPVPAALERPPVPLAPSPAAPEPPTVEEPPALPEAPGIAAVRRAVPWGEGPLVAIFHSHTSEMYRTDDFYPPHPDDYHRFGTEDTGIVQVGAALAERLRSYGIGVVHSRRIHDAPVHALAYSRSRETVKELLERHPTLQLILDVHRDSPAGLTAVVAGQRVGQVMILVGSGTRTRGLRNPHWEQNLAVARELEAIMNHRFPGLWRRTWVREDARFNQDLHPAMLLIEIGSYDTHIHEAVGTALLLGDAVAEWLWRRRVSELGATLRDDR